MGYHPEKLRQSEWAHENLMRFNSSKCKDNWVVVTATNSTSWMMTGWSTALLKRTGGTAGWQLDMSHHCALIAQRANHTLGTSKAAQPAQRGRGSAPLLCAVRPQLEHCIQMRSAQYRRDMELLERIQGMATKMIPGMELPYKDRLRSGAVQHGEEKALRRPESSLSISEGGL